MWSGTDRHEICFCWCDDLNFESSSSLPLLRKNFTNVHLEPWLRCLYHTECSWSSEPNNPTSHECLKKWSHVVCSHLRFVAQIQRFEFISSHADRFDILASKRILQLCRLLTGEVSECSRSQRCVRGIQARLGRHCQLIGSMRLHFWWLLWESTRLKPEL